MRNPYGPVPSFFSQVADYLLVLWGIIVQVPAGLFLFYRDNPATSYPYPPRHPFAQAVVGQ